MTRSSSRPFRFAHTGDWHIGSGYHLGDDGRDGWNSRLRDYRDSIHGACREMVAREVDAVLFAGDGFRDAKPTPTEVSVFAGALDILVDAGVPFIGIVGNHCLPKAPGRAHALQVFNGYRGADVRIFDRPGVTMVGDVPVALLPWYSRAMVAATDPEFETLGLDEQNSRITTLLLAVLRKLDAETRAKAGPFGTVLLAHTAISGATIGQAENATRFFREPLLPVSEIRGLGFTYQAHGHFHHAQESAPGCWYSGSIDRVDYNEAAEDKGWLEVEVEAGEGCNVTWHSSSPRPFVDLELSELSAWESEIASLNGALPGAIVRVRYEATPEEARAVDHQGIRRALYGAGALKVHGPLATLRHSVAERESTLSEETDALTGWQEYADRQGLTGSQRERLDRLVEDALEGVTG